jgi:hypothetical protein
VQVDGGTLSGPRRATPKPSNVFDGLPPVQHHRRRHRQRTSSQARDNLGKIALQNHPRLRASQVWACLGRLGSTIAHTNPETAGTTGTPGSVRLGVLALFSRTPARSRPHTATGIGSP